MADKLQGGVKAGSVDVTLPVLLRSTADNTEVTGKVFGDVTLSYQRQGAARVAITAATQTVTGSHSDGGFVEIDATNMPGIYRLDVPDAAFATGVDFVVITVVCSGCYAFHRMFELTTNVVQSQDHESALTTIDGIVDAILIDTDTTIPALIAALNDLSAAEVNTEVDTALADYDGPTNAEMTAGFSGLNDLSAAEVNAEVDQALLDYDPPTKTELDSGLAALNDVSAAEVNAQVDAALVDYDAATGAELAAVDTKIDTIDGIVDAIRAVTDLLPDGGALTTLQSNVTDILADTNELQSDDVPGLIAALNDLSASDVWANVLSELGTVPGATPTAAEAVMLAYMMTRNEQVVNETTGERRINNDAGTVIIEQDATDDGTEFTQSKMRVPGL